MRFRYGYGTHLGEGTVIDIARYGRHGRVSVLLDDRTHEHTCPEYDTWEEWRGPFVGDRVTVYRTYYDEVAFIPTGEHITIKPPPLTASGLLLLAMGVKHD